MKPKILQFNVTTKDLGEGLIEAVINSGQEDRMGEVLDINGVDLKNFKNNPVVLWSHHYDQPPVAKAISIKKENGQLVSRMQFAIDEYPFAHTIYKLYKGGYLRTFSIGFIPKEMEGNVYTKSEMLEYSATPVPADPLALAKAVKKGIDITSLLEVKETKVKEEVKEEIEESKIEVEKEKESEKVEEVKEDQTEKVDKKEIKQNETINNLSTKNRMDEKQIKEMISSISSEVSKSVDEKIENIKKELDVVKTKDINDVDVAKDKDLGNGGKEVSKEMKLLLYVKGLVNKNFAPYLEVVGKDLMDTSNTGEVLPPYEFVAEIERITGDIGVAQRNARVKNSTAPGVRYIVGDTKVQVYDTDEAGEKKSTKNTYNNLLLTWRKFAAIMPMTDELNEDSAVDLWNDGIKMFSEAFATKEDNLVFNNQVENAVQHKGICYVPGTNVVVLSGNIESLDYDDLSKALFGVPSSSAKNGKWYLNNQALGLVHRIKDQYGAPIWQRAMADGTPATIMGKPYELTDVLPEVVGNEAVGNLPFIVFGDLDYVTLGIRTGMQMKIFDSGIVNGVEDEEEQINLLTQDAQALRVVKRMNAVVRFPKAFSVIKTNPAVS